MRTVPKEARVARRPQREAGRWAGPGSDAAGAAPGAGSACGGRAVRAAAKELQRRCGRETAPVAESTLWNDLRQVIQTMALSAMSTLITPPRTAAPPPPSAAHSNV